MYYALEYELSQRWTMELELQASILERLDALLLVTMKANGAKNTPSHPIRVPRPHLKSKSSKLEAVSFGDYITTRL